VLYQESGLEGLKALNYQGKRSALDEHANTLEAHFQDHPPRTVAEAQAEIEKRTGIKRSPSQVRAFLRRLGMKRCKVGYTPDKLANPDKQAEQEAF
jgi:transposase